MASSYPGSLDSFTNPTGSDTLDSPDHATQHSDVNDATEALEAKVGTGAGTPTEGKVLKGGATAGSATWQDRDIAYVNHGATAGTTRPVGATSVKWVGSVEPTNATSADEWWDTTDDLLKSKASGSFVASGTGTYEPARTGYTAGRYYGGMGVYLSSAPALTDRLWTLPVVASSSVSIDRVGIEVVSAVASSVIRLGLYADDGGGLPGDLVADFGTVDSSSTGFKEITVSETLAAGRHHFTAVAQSGASNPTVRALTPAGIPFGAVSGTQAAAVQAYVTAASYSGALPDPHPTLASNVGNMPGIVFRVA